MGAMVPVELKLLMAAVIVGLIQIVWAAAAGRGGERNLPWLMGPRDEPKPVGLVAARLDRALANFLETFPLFAGAVLACAAAGKLGGPLTIYGSALYVIGARALCAALCGRHAAPAHPGVDGEHGRHRHGDRGVFPVRSLA